MSLLPALAFLRELSHQKRLTGAAILFLVSFFGTQFVMAKLRVEYIEIRPFERGGRLYEMLGVRLFRFIVPMGDGINRLVRRFQPDYRIVNEQSIADFEKRTVTAELFHLGCLLVIVPSTVYAIVLGWWEFALLLTLPNVPLHLYPILLQRYTRARIQRLRQRRPEGLESGVQIGSTSARKTDPLGL